MDFLSNVSPWLAAGLGAIPVGLVILIASSGTEKKAQPVAVRAPPISPGHHTMIVKDRNWPPNWGGTLDCDCKDTKAFWDRWFIGSAKPTETRWEHLAAPPNVGALTRMVRRFTSDVLPRPGEPLWKLTQRFHDPKTGDTCRLRLYIRDVEEYLAVSYPLALPRSGAPPIVSAQIKRPKGGMVFKTAPNTNKSWENGWSWTRMHGLTEYPKIPWADELSLQRADRERMIQQLAETNQNLTDAVKAIGRTNSTLGGIKHYLKGISDGIWSTQASVSAAALGMGSVNHHMDHLTHEMRQLNGRIAGAASSHNHLR